MMLQARLMLQEVAYYLQALKMLQYREMLFFYVVFGAEWSELSLQQRCVLYSLSC
jgi:hypothetical protein